MGTRRSYYKIGDPRQAGRHLTPLMLLMLVPRCCRHPVVRARDGSAVILAFDLGRMDLDDSMFRGDSPQLSLTLGSAFNPRYDITFSFSGNVLLSASVNDGSEPDDRVVDKVHRPCRFQFRVYRYSPGFSNNCWATAEILLIRTWRRQ